MVTDFLVLFKGEKRQAHCVVLYQGLADHLSLLIRNLLCQSKDFGLFDILHLTAHFIFLLILQASRNSSNPQFG